MQIATKILRIIDNFPPISHIHECKFKHSDTRKGCKWIENVLECINPNLFFKTNHDMAGTYNFKCMEVIIPRNTLNIWMLS